MDGHFSSFTKSAKDLSKNPLGIIALFIIMVYGFACLLFGFSAEVLVSNERLPLIWFVIIFPVIVLILFGWLVSRHHTKLYSPKDFRDDKSFLHSYQQSSSATVEAIKVSSKNKSDMMEIGKEFEIVAAQEKLIRADLTFREIEHKGETADILIHSIAIAQTNTWFERAYSTIFGSQISLMRRITGFPEGIPHKSLEEHFEDVQNKQPESFNNWTLDQYLRYLFNMKFVEQKGDNFLVTKRGIDFLGILSMTNYSESKVL
jgi:hypothetical protein